ncbi:MAG: hypothetical protein IT452_04790 [Planctomycetia bacterium]|nr:hypothetical protein [Planctomycetia bacterium]
MAAPLDPMMAELKAYRRKLGLRLAKADREGRFAQELRRICRSATRWYNAQIAAIEREDAARKRRARRATARSIERPPKPRRSVRTPGRHR